MKVALIVPGGVDASGEVRVIPALLALIRRLAAAHELHVFATHQEPRPRSWRLEGAAVHNLGLPHTVWRALAAIRGEHRKAPFRVVQSIFAGRSGALAVAAGTLLRVPSFVHVAGGELVALPDIQYGGCSSWRGRMLQRTVLRRATEITAASASICALVAGHGAEARRVPLGVDLQRWPLLAPRRRQRGAQARLVHVASLNRVKDQTTLLRAARVLADRGCDFRLDVVGEDTLHGEMQALAAELQLTPRVTFHGFLTQRELRPLVERADLAVISSRHEAGPLAVLEAAAAGVPTVGTAVGHIAEWSPHAARAVPCSDPGALAAAIAEVIECEDLRLRLADEALQRAGREDADHTARLYEELSRRRSSTTP
jgi:glycosyltransferase involved in cell wall biosynthesis